MDIYIDSDIDSYNDNTPRLEDGSSINLPMAGRKFSSKRTPKVLFLRHAAGEASQRQQIPAAVLEVLLLALLWPQHGAE